MLEILKSLHTVDGFALQCAIRIEPPAAIQKHASVYNSWFYQLPFFHCSSGVLTTHGPTCSSPAVRFHDPAACGSPKRNDLSLASGQPCFHPVQVHDMLLAARNAT